ncbi:MAG TPA: response regulator [Rectinema sp.]|nr:response regulator [Rectinema sp.]HOR48809.1 response regulator [Rectinema sp.]HPL71477.1 response regulator [Rectinema sp.]
MKVGYKIIDTIVDLGGGFFRIGAPSLVGALQPNSYLLIDESEAILFGPGPEAYHDQLKSNILKCAEQEILRTIVIHGEEPGIASSLSHFEKDGSVATIVTDLQTWNQLCFYGLTMQPYILDEHGWLFKLASGRVLQFLPTPYLPQPSAFVTYDEKTKTLLTGGLCSSYSTNLSLYEYEGFLDQLTRFHRVNMPSRELLAPVLEALSLRDIERILPSYGAIIHSDIKSIFNHLSSIECGELFQIGLADELYARAVKEGASSEELALLQQELHKLRKLNEELNNSIEVSRDRAIRDEVTGLYSEAFYNSFIEEEAAIRISETGPEDHVLAIISLDENIAQIEYKYGSKEVEALLRGVARILLQNLPKTAMAFRLHGATMAIWIPAISFNEAVNLFDRMRYEIETSKVFIEPITVSIGLSTLAEASESQPELEKIALAMTDIGIRRLHLARKKGGNTVYFGTTEEEEAQSLANIMIVDDDEANVEVLKTYFVNQGYAILTASDGQEALSLLGKEAVEIVISELMVPKIDAYRLKESMLTKTATKDIPVIVMSHLKTELSVRRAYDLGILYYLQKPIMLEELLGIVKVLSQTGKDE